MMTEWSMTPVGGSSKATTERITATTHEASASFCYLVSPIRYEGMQRIEELEIPQKALRELIYNAIVHKLYSGPAILLRVFDKSVELWNYGLLPEELTPADLMKKHASYPRNRNIATVFYKAGFIESWGRGYKKIREEFEKAGHPVPTVEESGGGVLVTIQRKTIEEIIASSRQKWRCKWLCKQ